jgi:hypothetical protein
VSRLLLTAQYSDRSVGNSKNAPENRRVGESGNRKTEFACADSPIRQFRFQSRVRLAHQQIRCAKRTLHRPHSAYRVR